MSIGTQLGDRLLPTIKSSPLKQPRILSHKIRLSQPGKRTEKDKNIRSEHLKLTSGRGRMQHFQKRGQNFEKMQRQKPWNFRFASVVHYLYCNHCLPVRLGQRPALLYLFPNRIYFIEGGRAVTENKCNGLQSRKVARTERSLQGQEFLRKTERRRALSDDKSTSSKYEI